METTTQTEITYYVFRDGQSNTAAPLGCVAVVTAESAEEAVAATDAKLYNGQYLAAVAEADMHERFPATHADHEHDGAPICLDCWRAADTGPIEDADDRGQTLDGMTVEECRAEGTKVLRALPRGAAPAACWSCVQMAAEGAEDEARDEDDDESDDADDDANDEDADESPRGATVAITGVSAGDTGAGGWDVDATVAINGETLDGGVTLVADGINGGAPVAYGDSLDAWIDGRLLAWMRERVTGDALRALARDIESSACDAIRASGVEAAAAYRDAE